MHIRILFIVIACLFGFTESSPNIIFILLDDLGYGDLKITNPNSTNETPHIDKMIKEGTVFTDYYSPASVCTPARGSILTGQYFRKLGLYPDVLHPYISGGLSELALTYPEILRRNNYSTHAIGKWHLGIKKGHRAIDHGFDTYYGVPMSHNECISDIQNTGSANLQSIFGPCPIFENEKIIEQGFINTTKLDEMYLEKTIDIIKTYPKFYIHLSTHHVHMPQYPLNNFQSSLSVVDDTIGKIIENIDNNTIIITTSDNGATYFYGPLGGSNKPLRCSKGSTWEGGHRVPAIVYSKSNLIPKNIKSNLFFTGLDWFSTILGFANISDKNFFDGYNMAPFILKNNKSSPREMFFFHSTKIGYSIDSTGVVMAVRWKNYKYHRFLSGGNCVSFYPDEECRWNNILKRGGVLYDLNKDIGETNPISDIKLTKMLDQKITDHIKNFNDGASIINKNWNSTGFPCANQNCNPFPYCCFKFI